MPTLRKGAKDGAPRHEGLMQLRPEGTAMLPKTRRSQVDRMLDPNRNITLGSLQQATALVGQRVVIESV